MLPCCERDYALNPLKQAVRAYPLNQCDFCSHSNALFVLVILRLLRSRLRIFRLVGVLCRDSCSPCLLPLPSLLFEECSPLCLQFVKTGLELSDL
jgi:hypothetical protein